ncbi:unnamed protein product [Clonostachys chloroleuca]|uniref:Uncharacterized protein n=1 Tax=Clonostachys chloroleuca TaxID=1926264 RepID=A0AA35Q1U8_9HYPO|nr:unnamed protein product [Clonostachys chloroleuca]
MKREEYEETGQYDATPRTMGQEDDRYIQWINSKTKKAFAMGGNISELDRINPDVVCGLSLQLQANGPRVGPISANHVLGLDGLGAIGLLVELRSLQHVRRVVRHQVASKQAVLCRASVRLLRCSLFLAQMAEIDRDWVGIGIFDAALVNVQTGRQDATFHLNATAAKLIDGIEEEALDSSLAQNNLLETTDAGDGVGKAGGTMDDTVTAGIPEANLEHVVGFHPSSMPNTERI